MTNRKDQILDACLEEVLGGHTPPDLTARIMQARSSIPAPPIAPTAPPTPWSAVPFESNPIPPPLASDVPMPAGTIRTAPPGIAARPGKTSSTTPWTSIALVGLVLVSGTALGLSGLLLSTPEKPRTTAAQGKPKLDGTTAQAGNRTKPDAIAENKRPPGTRRDRGSTRPGSNASSTPRIAQTDVPNGDTPPDTHVTTPPIRVDRPPRSVVAISDQQVVDRINEALEREWTAANVRPAGPATDAEWCRRVYLRVIGRIPSVEEVDRFVAQKSDGKRQALVDELLGPRYAGEFAAHWATVWTNALLGRHELAGNSPASREGLTEYLRSSIESHKGFDQMTTELIAATGSNQRGDDDYNPAVNFLLAHSHGTGTQAAGRVARVFLGARLQCAECHVHPSGTWSQDQLWQLAAFFRQMKSQRDTGTQAARLVNVDYRGEGKDPHQAASYFELANGQLKAAFPVFLDGSAGSRSGLVNEADRRTELAQFVAQSPQLARTTVNRLWAHFLGYGFSQPIDDLGPHNQPSHPELMNQLASDFAGQGYDLNRLMRWIALSDAFGFSSKSTGDELADSPESGQRPLFARYYSRPMQPEELSKSLQMLADARGKSGAVGADQARVAILRQLGRAMPKDDTDDSRGIRQPIPHSLILAQQSLSAHAVGGPDGSLVRKVAENQAMALDDKIEHLFQAALARKPTAAELKSSRRLVVDSPADLQQGLSDLWWVLLNSNEFILDH